MSGRWRSPSVPATYSLVRSFRSSLENSFGNLNTYTRISLTSLPPETQSLFQQQRIYQTPKPISTTARINHQKADGSTSERMMIKPARIETNPRIQERLLRIKQPPAL